MTARKYPPAVQACGGTVLSILAAMGPFRRTGEKILGEHGITDVHPDGWYPLQGLVDALNALEARIGPKTLQQVGRNIPDHIALPPGIDTFEKVCASFGMAFDLNHRGEAGVISYRMEGDRSAAITSQTPYPCDFDQGVIHGFFRKLIGSRVEARHDPNGPCKKTGGACCVHLVTSG